MQGSNADIIKVAMVRIHDRLREEGRGARLVLQVHDELLLEVPDAELSAVKELVREEMCGAFDLDPPLAVDIGTGRATGAEAKILMWRLRLLLENLGWKSIAIGGARRRGARRCCRFPRAHPGRRRLEREHIDPVDRAGVEHEPVLPPSARAEDPRPRL